MSTDKDMYAFRENVLILNSEKDLVSIHYDSIVEGNYYTIPLISGSYSIYKKTNLFDDDLIQTVKFKDLTIPILNTFL